MRCPRCKWALAWGNPACPRCGLRLVAHAGDGRNGRSGDPAGRAAVTGPVAAARPVGGTPAVAVAVGAVLLALCALLASVIGVGGGPSAAAGSSGDRTRAFTAPPPGSLAAVACEREAGDPTGLRAADGRYDNPRCLPRFAD